MIVAGFDGGVRITLEPGEAIELAAFLNQFYAGDGSVPDVLCAQLADIFPPVPGEEA